MKLNKTIYYISMLIPILLYGIVITFRPTWIWNLLYSNAENSITEKDLTTSQVSNKESLIDGRMAALTSNINEYVIKQALDRDEVVSSTRHLFKWSVEADRDYKYNLFQYKKTNIEINFMRFSKSENYFSKELCLKYNTSGFCEDNGFDNPDKLRMENDIEFYTAIISSGNSDRNLALINYNITKEKYHSDTGIISHEKILEIFGLPDMN